MDGPELPATQILRPLQQDAMPFKKIDLLNISPAKAIAHNLVLVDKTRYIERLENGLESEVAVFLRPHRFGKTLFTVLLQNYYDTASTDQFEKNFKGTWIASHKTVHAGSYCCLALDFSYVSSRRWEAERSFASTLIHDIKIFSATYPNLGMDSDRFDGMPDQSPDGIMSAFLENFAQKATHGERLFVIIDEYDGIASGILSRGGSDCSETAPAQGDVEGFLKRFYACLKRYCGTAPSSPIARIFITGVTTLTLDLISSAFNGQIDISARPECSAMAGLTRDELSSVIDETVNFRRLKGVKKKQLLEAMERLFDGQCFSPQGGERIYNTGICLDYIWHVLYEGCIPFRLPLDIIAADSLRIEFLMGLVDPKAKDELEEEIFSKEPFAFDEAAGLSLKLDRTGHFGAAQAMQWLKCQGFLSYAGRGSKDQPMAGLRCANGAFHQAFVMLFKEEREFPTVLPDIDLDMVCSSSPGVSQLIAAVKKLIDSLLDDGVSRFDEMALQMCFDDAIAADKSGMLSTCLKFDTRERGIADLLVMNRNEDGRNFLFEIKYLPKSKDSDAAVKAKLSEAKERLLQCKDAPNVRAIGNLDCWAVVFAGDKCKAAKLV